MGAGRGAPVGGRAGGRVEVFVVDLGEVEGEAVFAGDDRGDLGEREVFVDVGAEGVVDAVVEPGANGAAADRIGLVGDEGVEEFAQADGAGVLDGEG